MAGNIYVGASRTEASIDETTTFTFYALNGFIPPDFYHLHWRARNKPSALQFTSNYDIAPSFLNGFDYVIKAFPSRPIQLTVASVDQQDNYLETYWEYSGGRGYITPILIHGGSPERVVTFELKYGDLVVASTAVDTARWIYVPETEEQAREVGRNLILNPEATREDFIGFYGVYELLRQKADNPELS